MSDQQSAAAGGQGSQEHAVPADPQAQPVDELQRVNGDAVGITRLQPSRPHLSRLWPWFIIAMVALVLAISGIDAFFGIFQHTAEESHTFHVVKHAKLEVQVASGSVAISNGGDNSRVTIQEKKQVPLFNPFPTVSYSQLGDTISAVEQGNKGYFFGDSNVSFAISVPANTDLHIQTDSGQITVGHISGRLSLMASNGPITAMDDTLCGSSVLHSDTGSITFSGRLAAHGRDEISSDTGAVDVTLPRDAAFHLDAKSNIGPFSSSYAGLIARPLDTLGSEVHGDVGTSPTVILTLKSNTGPIDMHYLPPRADRQLGIRSRN